MPVRMIDMTDMNEIAMTFAEITPYIISANFALTWGIGFYVHLVNKNKATTDKMEHLEHKAGSQFADHGERLSRLEAGIKVALTHEDLDRVYHELNATTQQVSRLRGEISQMNDNLRMLLHQMGERRSTLRT